MSKRNPYRSAGRQNPPALHARNHPRSIRDRIDYDYLKDLPDTDADRDPSRGNRTPKEWLAKFTDEFHSGAYPKGMDELHTTVDLKRTCTRAKSSANRDGWAALHSEPEFRAAVGDATTPTSEDYSPTPAYLNSQEYKEALADYRRQLRSTPKSREERRALTGTKAQKEASLKAAHLKLRRVVKNG